LYFYDPERKPPAASSHFVSHSAVTDVNRKERQDVAADGGKSGKLTCVKGYFKPTGYADRKNAIYAESRAKGRKQWRNFLWRRLRGSGGLSFLSQCAAGGKISRYLTRNFSNYNLP